VVGAGLGVHFAYVDLALNDLDHGITLVRQVWRRLGIAGPAWMQFCDSARRREWVGLSVQANAPSGCDREIWAGAVAKAVQVS
jgi:hypothetical protein